MQSFKSARSEESKPQAPSANPVDNEEQREAISRVLEHRRSNEGNVGLDEYLESVQRGIQLTPELSQHIRRKIDLRVLSIFFITSILQFLDKTALNYANLFGMKESLELTGSQYSWLASLFYFGYLITQLPSTVIFHKFPTGKVIGIFTVLWGVTILVFPWSKNFVGASICRFLLGVFEAPITPGITLAVGYWWTRSEAPLRYTFIYSALGWAGIIGSLMSTGVSRMSDDGPVRRWEFVFVLLGSITTAWGFVVFFFLPDSPVDASWLDRDEKILATARVAQNQVGIKSADFKLYQVKHALLDLKTWCIVLSTFAAGIPNGLISNFSTQIIKDLGFSTTRTTLLDCVGNAFQVVGLFLGGFIASYVPNSRILVSTVGNIACLIASCIMAFTPFERTWMRLVAFWWVNVQTVSFSLALNMISVNMSGYTKKQFSSAMTFIAYCVGNIVGPHFVIQEEKPKYPTGTKAMVAGFSGKFILHLILGVYLLVVNRQRDSAANRAGTLEAEQEIAEGQGMLDQTEFENKAMRYVL